MKTKTSTIKSHADTINKWHATSSDEIKEASNEQQKYDEQYDSAE